MDQNAPQLRVGLESSTGISCTECGNDTFHEVVYLRKISKILTGTAEDALIPIPSFACSKCGNVNPEFKMKFPHDKKEEKKSNIILG